MLLLLLLSAFISLRLGAIFKSVYAGRSNGALWYYNIEFILVPNLILSRQNLWIMKIIFVFLKPGYQSSNPWAKSFFLSLKLIKLTKLIGKLL